MAEPTNQAPTEGTPARRGRAPTITIDTTAVSSPGAPDTRQDSQRQQAAAMSPQDDAISPSTTVDPAAASFTSAQQQQLGNDASGESRDSRPQSPHNYTPVLGRGDNFLSVPQKPSKSRQNSMDSDDASRTAVQSSQGGESSATASSQSDRRSRSPGSLNNDKIMNDPEALKPDTAELEATFHVDDNPFAFSPGQLNKLFQPKSLSAFYALGGLDGLEKGLQSDRKAGLSVDEAALDKSVSFDEVSKGGKLAADGVNGGDAKAGGGLRPADARAKSGDDRFYDRKRVYTENQLPEKKGKSLLQIMWITYNDKVLILLSIAAAISLAVGIYQTLGIEHEDGAPQIEWVEGVAIIAAIVIVVFVGSLNDFQKERQFAKLNKKKQDRMVKVTRSGRITEVIIHDLMVGDVIHLEPGDLVPVDGILIEGFGVKCDESQATGESDIIKKTGGSEVFEAIEANRDLKKMDPFIQSGSKVMEGVGTFMTTSVGVHSTYGRILMSFNEDPEMTPLQSKLNVIAEYIAKLGGAAGLLLFIVLFIIFLTQLPGMGDVTAAEKGQKFLGIFIMVVTIIVVAVPEGLPLAVTLALAFATNRMLKDNNLVRLLKACEVMGNATSICSDKTGTLTQNVMLVVAATVGTTVRFGGARPTSSDSDDMGHVVDDSADITPTQFASMLCSQVKDLLLKSIALNSTAYESRDEDGNMTFLGSKTETALLILARDHLGMGPVAEERENATTLQLYPFDSGRKCMGIVVQKPGGGARLLVKGASEIVLEKCSHILSNPASDDSAARMTPDNNNAILTLINSYATRSLRTIGLVYKDFESWPPRAGDRDEKRREVEFAEVFGGMTFVGVVGIQDPLREGVRESVAQCQRAGVVVRMVTGDNKTTAEAIARECGIIQPGGVVMEGPEFRRLSKQEQLSVSPKLHVLARSSPEDKRILVERLRSLGETVAVTGDGTNDAPALKGADIGFSMGIAGTEVAKEASDIILMDDNFKSIVSALKWGRAVNDAVKRFLQFQLTVNVTAVVLTFVTAVSDPDEEAVLTAVQLLWVNLIMDTLAALALATDPPNDSLLKRKPERRNASIISITMWKMILGQAIYQLTITFILYYGGSHENPEHRLLPFGDDTTVDQVKTLVFNTFVWMQIFNQWNNRRLDNEFNIFEGILNNWFFIGINVLMCGAQVLIIFYGGIVLEIAEDGQTAVHWAIAIILGFISIPFGMVIRLIPDRLLERMIPDYLRRRHERKNAPDLMVTDEENPGDYPFPVTEVRDELAFLKRIKGGRLNNLKFAMRHPRETFMQRSRSPSHSRSGSVKQLPTTPVAEREDSFAPSMPPTPDTRQRSKSMRSRSNSQLGAPTVMAGLVAAGVAAGWTPGRTNSRDERAPGIDEAGGGGDVNTNNNNDDDNEGNNGSKENSSERTPREL